MSDASRLLREVTRELDDAGLRGWCLARDLHTGEEVALDADEPVPLASLVKVPLALAVLDRVHRGDLDGAAPLELASSVADLPGGVGVTRFRHPARIAVDDVVYLAVALSDNVAADALFELVPPAEVTAFVRGLGIDGLVVRHPVADLSATPVEAMPDHPDLALSVATGAATAGGGHRVRQLDTSRSSAGTPRAVVDLLELVWRDDGPMPGEVTARLRWLMTHAVHRQRLWPDLASDEATWASKTGTLLTLRHEAGVLEGSGADGELHAVAVLTESRVAAMTQPGAEATMGAVARRLVDHLRAGA